MSQSLDQVHIVDFNIDSFFNFNEENIVDSDLNHSFEQSETNDNHFSLNQGSLYAKDLYSQPSKNYFDANFVSTMTSPGSTNCSQETVKEGSHFLSPNTDIETTVFSSYDYNSNENADDDGDDRDDEDDEDEEEKKLPAKKSKGKAKKAPRKKAEKSQNKMKNFPGLITQRVKTSITETNAFGEHLTKIFGSAAVGRVKEFLKDYEKQWKTWTSIEKFLVKDRTVGGMLLEFILEFLSPRSSDHFNQYVDSGKMNEKNRETMKKSKDFFYEKFEKLTNNVGGPYSPMRSEETDSTRFSEFGMMTDNILIVVSECEDDDIDVWSVCYGPCSEKKLKTK